MTERKKLIEVALPLEAINAASVREKSIRHGHPSTLHLWWARRPLAAARAVIFTSLVDDPNNPAAPPAFVNACESLPTPPSATLEQVITPRDRLFYFIERLVQWESTTNDDILDTARQLIMLSTDGNPPPLLDPFAGGGSIPLEAQRLGLEAHASDLNPVAVMINKAQIEIPPRFAHMPPVNPQDRKQLLATAQPKATATDTTWRGASGLATDVRYYGEWMRERAWERIGHLYPTLRGETVIAWLWARTVKCPNPACGANMPLVTSFEVSKKKGRQVWIEPIIKTEQGNPCVEFVVRREQDGDNPKNIQSPPKTGRGARFDCLACGEPAHEQHIKAEGMAGRMGAQLLAIVTEGKGGRNYHSPTAEHQTLAKSAKPEWYPTGTLAPDKRSMFTPLYGLSEFRDLFTPRQLVALTTFSDLVAEAREQAYQDALAAGLPDDDRPLRDGGRGARAYAEAVSVYLAFAVDKQTDRSSSLSSWDISRDNLRNLFGRQAIPMVWDYAEGNIFCESGGSWNNILEWIYKVLEHLPAYRLGQAVQQDAMQLESSAIALSTDPPYYDNIGYADLSDFFYVWMRASLKDVYPDLFSTLLVPKAPELVATPYRFDGDKKAANRFFEDGMVKAFSRMRRFTHPDYPLTVYYAFKQQESDEVEDISRMDDDEAGDTTTTPKDKAEKATVQASTGWETMLTGILRAGFAIVGTYPMRTELGNRMVGMGTNALASSIVIVCRPRPQDAPTTTRRHFMDALRQELPLALENLQSGNVAPVDMAQASIGPGMAVYSRYSKVLEADGTLMSVREAQRIINQILDEHLAKHDGELDEASQFAVAWFESFGFKEGDFGTADTLARAKNTAVDSVAAAGVVRSAHGKVQIIHYTAYDDWDPQTDKRPTVWEATHHLIKRLNERGEKDAAELIEKMPGDMASHARDLAYRMYNICERKKWADLARDYNMLVASWSGITDALIAVRQTRTSGYGTKQESLFD
jgi:putative DNA methylase